MLTKITATMLMALNMANADRNASYARCSFGTENNPTGKFLIAHYEDSNIYITGNFHNLTANSEHYVSITENAGQYPGYCYNTGNDYDPFGTNAPYNHLRPILTDAFGKNQDYESRDSQTTMFGDHTIYARSISIRSDWQRNSNKLACCNIEMIDKATYMGEWLDLARPEPKVLEIDLQ